MPPPSFFISVSHNFNTQTFVIKKKSVKNTCLSFSLYWDPLWSWTLQQSGTRMRNYQYLFLLGSTTSTL